MIKSPGHFYKEYWRTTKMLLACKNAFYVSDTAKKEIKEGNCPLDREHLTYLISTDPDLDQILKNRQGV